MLMKMELLQFHDNQSRIQEILRLCSTQNTRTDLKIFTVDQSGLNFVQTNANLIFLPALREKLFCNETDLTLILPSVTANSVQAALEIVHTGKTIMEGYGEYEEVIELLKLFGIKGEELHLKMGKTLEDPEPDPITIKLIEIKREETGNTNFKHGFEHYVDSMGDESELTFDFDDALMNDKRDSIFTGNTGNIGSLFGASNLNAGKKEKHNLAEKRSKRKVWENYHIALFDGFKFSESHDGSGKCLIKNCGKEFSRRKILKEHMCTHFTPLIKENNEYDYKMKKCSICRENPKFNSSNSYARHVFSFHTNFFYL